MESRKFGGLSFEDLDRAASLDQKAEKPSQPASSISNQYSEWVQPAASAKPAAPIKPAAPVKPATPTRSASPQAAVPVQPAAPIKPEAPVKPETPTRSASPQAAVPVQSAASAKSEAPAQTAISSQSKSSGSAGISAKTAGTPLFKSEKTESPSFRRHKYGCIGAMAAGLLLVIISMFVYASSLSSRGDVMGPTFFVMIAAAIFSVGLSGLILTKIMDPTGQTKGSLRENFSMVFATISISMVICGILFSVICFSLIDAIL